VDAAPVNKITELPQHFFYPDYTVGPGLSPDLLTLLTQALAGSEVYLHTAGGELRPALKCIPDMMREYRKCSHIPGKNKIRRHTVLK